MSRQDRTVCRAPTYSHRVHRRVPGNESVLDLRSRCGHRHLHKHPDGHAFLSVVILPVCFGVPDQAYPAAVDHKSGIVDDRNRHRNIEDKVQECRYPHPEVLQYDALYWEVCRDPAPCEVP